MEVHRDSWRIQVVTKFIKATDMNRVLSFQIESVQLEAVYVMA